MSDTPIEDCLDELMRRTHADVRSTRRLIEEAAAHLYATAAELQEQGMTRVEAENEAVHRFGPLAPLAHATTRQTYAAFTARILRAFGTLVTWALLVAGISGVLALPMVLIFGEQFVGSVNISPFGGASIAATAWGTVILRVALGIVGVLVLYGIRFRQRRIGQPTAQPPTWIDAVAAFSFFVATAVLTLACVAQAVQNSLADIGYPLSAALATSLAAAYFARRSARHITDNRTGIHPPVAGQA